MAISNQTSSDLLKTYDIPTQVAASSPMIVRWSGFIDLGIDVANLGNIAFSRDERKNFDVRLCLPKFCSFVEFSFSIMYSLKEIVIY